MSGPWRFEVDHYAFPGSTAGGIAQDPEDSWEWAIYVGPDRDLDDVVLAGVHHVNPTGQLAGIVARHNARVEAAAEADRVDEMERDLATLMPIALALSSADPNRIAAAFAATESDTWLQVRDDVEAVTNAIRDARAWADRVLDGDAQSNGHLPGEFGRLAEYNAAKARGETFAPTYETRMHLAQLRFDAAQLQREILTHDWVVVMPGGGYLSGHGDVIPTPATPPEGQLRVTRYAGDPAATADALQEMTGEHPAVTDGPPPS